MFYKSVSNQGQSILETRSCDVNLYYSEEERRRRETPLQTAKRTVINISELRRPGYILVRSLLWQCFQSHPDSQGPSATHTHACDSVDLLQNQGGSARASLARVYIRHSIASYQSPQDYFTHARRRISLGDGETAAAIRLLGDGIKVRPLK